MNFALLFSLGIVLILCCYYGGIWWMYRRPTLDSPNIQEDIPHQFSPALLRFFWTGKLEWSALMLIGLHAVQEKIYILQQGQNNKSVRFRLVAPERFGKLAHEERAAFSMGRGVPLSDIIFAKKRRPIHVEMMSRLETYLRKTYKAYLLPFERLVYVGLLLQWLLYLSLLLVAPEALFGDITFFWVTHAFGFALITVLGGKLMINRLRWENKALSWAGIVIFIVAVSLSYVIPIGDTLGIYTMYMFTLLIHGFSYHYLPRLTKKGWEQASEIEGYRNHLLHLHATDTLPDNLLPYAMALEIDPSIGEFRIEILSEENVTEGEWLRDAIEMSSGSFDDGIPWWK